MIGTLIAVAISVLVFAPRETGAREEALTDEPIIVSGRTVRMWDARPGRDRWMIIEGQASIFQGSEGVRGDRALARIIRTPDQRYQAEIYVEGRVSATKRPGSALPAFRDSFRSSREIRLPQSPQALIPLAQPPDGHPLLARMAELSPRALNPAIPHQPSEIVGDQDEDAPPRITFRGLLPSGPEEDEGPPLPPLADSEVVRVRVRVQAEAEERADEKKPASPPDPEELGPPTPIAPDGGLAEPGGAPPPPLPDRSRPSRPSPIPGEGVKPIPDDLPDALTPALPDPEAEAPKPPAGAGREESDSAPPPPPEPEAPSRPAPNANGDIAPAAPVLPLSQKPIRVLPRSGGSRYVANATRDPATGQTVVLYSGGVNFIVENHPKYGTVDIAADQAVAWIHDKPKPPAPGAGPGSGPKPNAEGDAKAEGPSPLSGDFSELGDDQPIEIYLEGNVAFRLDPRKLEGKFDQTIAYANHAYYDFQSQNFSSLDSELELYLQEFTAPLRIRAGFIQRFNQKIETPNGRGGIVEDSRSFIRAEDAVTTGSRFAEPGYWFRSKTLDMTEIPADEPDEDGAPATIWRLDARKNAFIVNRLPLLYVPRFVADSDDLDPPLRALQFRANRVFGQQLLSDWSGFKLLGLQRPKSIVDWNIDIDYLSRRGFAAGTELSWYGRELIPGLAYDYFGYLDAWGLRDAAADILGPGPAIITEPPQTQLMRGFDRKNVPAFQDFRGRALLRHMQSFLPPDRGGSFEDFRLQLEFAYLSDRNFLEQYYKRLFDAGLDQSTLAYLIRQRRNWAFTALAEANPAYWQTETQWAPKLDYYRLGDAPLGWFTLFSHTGVDYANVHTATEVNNPNLFPLPDGTRAFLPFDPVSNTSGIFKSGRAYTSHELDLPINLDVIRIVPYAQGQLAGWTDQINNQGALGRAWGAVGARANIMAWKVYPGVESEIFNLHGLNHKMGFFVDARTSQTNAHLSRIGVQDDLDDNVPEFVRRYFALINYPRGDVPPQIDPRLLILRRGISPITGTTDIQDRIDTVRFGFSQRLQTKRGPEDGRRVVDYMVLNVSSTYFPRSDRDNFGRDIGQTMYDYRWNVGDRTSVTSQGWFESYDVTGRTQGNRNPEQKTGITVVNTSFNFQRPPRALFTVGYTFLDVATIQSSVLYTSYQYWLSPKWYTTATVSYDFGNSLLLGTTFSFTRIGADYLTTVGLAVDPQRSNYTFAVDFAPRINPSLRIGSGASFNRMDPRFSFAPTQ